MTYLGFLQFRFVQPYKSMLIYEKSDGFLVIGDVMVIEIIEMSRIGVV